MHGTIYVPRSMRHFASLLVVVCLLAPALVGAQGLVPCGGPGQEQCQTCHLVALTNNIVVWIVGVLALLAGIVIIFIGFSFVTSMGNNSVIQRAKGQFANIFIGLIIALAAWLGVNIFANGLLEENVGPWGVIQCIEQPDFVTGMPDSINAQKELVCSDESLTREELEFAGCVTENCTTADSCSVACDGGMLVPLPPPEVGWYCSRPGYYFPRPLPNTAACDPAVVSQYFGVYTDAARCIISKESSCGAIPLSRTDVLKNEGNRAFSFGAMQINITVHNLVGCGPGGSTLYCPQAFSGRNYDALIVDESLYQACATAAQDLSCNLRNGRIIRDNRGSWADWSTAASCGLL